MDDGSKKKITEEFKNKFLAFGALAKPKKTTSIFFIFISSLKIFKELFLGLISIRKYGLTVGIFGSARESLPEKYYKEAELIAANLVQKGFVVVTGGGFGIMQASNKGAYNALGESYGASINLPFEKGPNHFLTNYKTFDYFFIRKKILFASSDLLVFFPGGYGTLDELFESLTGIQTQKNESVPIILYGKDFWQPFLNIFEELMSKKYKTISKEDLYRCVLVDTPDELSLYVDRMNIRDVRNRIKNS